MKKNWIFALSAGVVAAIVFFASLANYAYPGVSAHLTVLWRGLDIATVPSYPFMSVFARLLGCGNLIAPICGVFATVLIYLLVSHFIAWRSSGEYSIQHREKLAVISGSAAAIVFVFSPAVRSAATHLEPRMFDFAWALIVPALAIAYLRVPKKLTLLVPIAMGVVAALGICDSALVLAFLPFYIAAVVLCSARRGKKPYLPVFAFVVSFLVVVPIALGAFDYPMTDFFKTTADGFKAFYKTPGWLFIALFSTLPFVTALFSSEKAFGEKAGLVQWLFHVAMTFVVILSVATPLAPSALLESFGICPVATSAFAAMTAGYLVAYWWLQRRHWIGLVSGGILSFVLLVTIIWNLFAFDGAKGAFADKIAQRIIADLGERKWLLTDGSIDDHLAIAAADAGKELNTISLARDLDKDYLDRLSALVKEKNLGGSKNGELVLALSLGVLPFVQDWFASDPSVAQQVAIYGAPDLWFTAGFTPVPELLFFGADAKREPDWTAWKELDALLEAPKGWGSYHGRRVSDPVDRLRFAIRRHVGFVANDRGVYLQDLNRDDDAFKMYDLVLTEIDSDNICALFNEFSMARAKYAKAVEKNRVLENEIKKAVEDKNRRYLLWRLGSYYGYIRDPEIFIRLGYTWARSGRPGDALAQIRRAIEFVPSDKRTILLNMMAALYANEYDQKKSRRIYEQVLQKNAEDHDALIGLMRLELLDGNSAKALAYLQRAAKASGDTKRAKIELAMVAMMKNEHSRSRELLRKVTESDPKDLQAWSLLAAVQMQQIDSTKDEKLKKLLTKELQDKILPSMEKQTHGSFDYYVQTTKAFILMRQGKEKRREARDAFVAASKARPDVTTTQDLVLGLDISLNDPASAEQHAREVLRRNRNAPLANYVMGSIALGKSEYETAESFLRKASDTTRPIPLALNDLAEVLRRKKKYTEAEAYARRAVSEAPKLYVAWETLGSILMDSKSKLDEAAECVRKACELSKSENGREEDVRMLISLARVQILNGDKMHAKATIRKVQSRISELSEYEKEQFKEIRKGVK